MRLTYGLKTGRWEKCVESIPSFVRALEIHPRDVHLPLALGSLYRLAERYCAAQLLLERVGEVERWLPSEMRMIGSLTLLGQVHLHRGRLDDAHACFRRAVSEYSGAPQIYASYVNALTLCGLGDLERMEGHYDEAVSHYTHGRGLLEAAPALMGCGYVVVRLETRLAGAFRLLRMRRKEELHLGAARAITRAREPYNFNWCWGVSEAELHYDWAVYHATCADLEAMLQSLRSAIAYGWREVSLLDFEPAFAFNRAHPALQHLLDEARRRPALPEYAHLDGQQRS